MNVEKRHIPNGIQMTFNNMYYDSVNNFIIIHPVLHGFIDLLSSIIPSKPF